MRFMSILRCYLYNPIDFLNFFDVLFNIFLVSLFSVPYFILFFKFNFDLLNRSF